MGRRFAGALLVNPGRGGTAPENACSVGGVIRWGSFIYTRRAGPRRPTGRIESYTSTVP